MSSDTVEQPNPNKVTGLLFTPGPVPMQPDICALGGEQTPYFRNEWFSDVVRDCEAGLLAAVKAPEGSRVVFLTASGTAGMEATVINLLSESDQHLVVNGGGFGQRFVDLCRRHRKPCCELNVGDTDLSDISAVAAEHTGLVSLLVNAHETSVGRLYNLDALGAFCRQQDLLFMVDAISMFLTDPLDMSAQHIDALILSSHKALGLHAGLSMVVLSPKALAQLKSDPQPAVPLYFDFADYLKDGERGQTPFTPAINIFMQLQLRLKQLAGDGLIQEQKRAADVAAYFRQAIKPLPLTLFSRFAPNAMTALTPTDGRSAAEIVQSLQDNYGITVTPNGGALKDTVFRVSHMGAMDRIYTETLVRALFDLYGMSDTATNEGESQ